MDVFAALLDTLGIDKVVVYGMSGGGPAAYTFAAKYPDRTKACLTECAVSGEFTHHQLEALAGCGMKFATTSAGTVRMMEWLAAKHPLTLMKTTLKNESLYTPAEIDDFIAEISNDPVRMALIPGIVEAAWAIPAFPHAFDTMCSEIPDY